MATALLVSNVTVMSEGDCHTLVDWIPGTTVGSVTLGDEHDGAITNAAASPLTLGIYCPDTVTA